MRKLKRAVARRNMERAGLTRVCDYGWFANHWREYVILPGKKKQAAIKRIYNK